MLYWVLCIWILLLGSTENLQLHLNRNQVLVLGPSVKICAADF